GIVGISEREALRLEADTVELRVQVGDVDGLAVFMAARRARLDALHLLAPAGGPQRDRERDGNLPPGACDDQTEALFAPGIRSLVKVETGAHGPYLNQRSYKYRTIESTNKYE